MNEEDRDLTADGSADPGGSGSGAADEMAAAYQSVASDPAPEVAEAKPSQPAPADSAANSLQQAALGVVLQRRAVMGMVFKQLWVILMSLVLVLLGVTFVPWSGLEDTDVHRLVAAAQLEAKARAEAQAVAVPNLDLEAAEKAHYAMAFAAEMKKTHAPGYTQGRGALIFFFTLWAIGATFLGILTNRFLLMPTAAAFLIGLFLAAMRLMAFLRADEVMDVVSLGFSEHGADGLGIATDIFGPGFIFVIVGCLFIPVYLIFSAVSGSKESKKAKGGSGSNARGGKGKASGGGSKKAKSGSGRASKSRK